jgi:hypothetical protein
VSYFDAIDATHRVSAGILTALKVLQAFKIRASKR